MSWKERLYLSLPYLLVLLGAAGIAVTEEVWLAIVSLVGMWFLPSPLTQPNVSRETSRRKEPSDHAPEWEARWREHVSRETSSEVSDLPVPCSVMHGSAEDHVLGCEGWSFPR